MRVRHALVASVSLVVVLAAAGYGLMERGEQAFASVGSVTMTDSNVVRIYGRVTKGGGSPLAGAVIEVMHSRRGRTVVDGIARTHASGRYRLRLQIPRRRYEIHVHKAPYPQAGYRVKASFERVLRPGMRLEVNARVVRGRGLFFVPIFNY